MFECTSVYFQAVTRKKCEKAQQPVAVVINEQAVKEKKKKFIC